MRPSRGLIGRERELAAVWDVVAGERPPRAAIVVGAPGIGKTSLWRAAVDRALEQGYLALVARPAEAEAALSFATLGDLFADAVDAIDALPAPQRRALRIALLLEETRSPVDDRTLAVATLSLLRRLAEEARVVVAIDDVQWVDAASAGALGYALRRVETEPIAFLGSARPASLRLAIDAETIAIPGLALADIGAIVEQTLGARPPRPVLRRIHSVSDGNPFFALEFARALARRGTAAPVTDPLPLPDNLSALVAERLSALSAATREGLAAAAALGQPTRAVVEAAVNGVDLDAAERAGVIEPGAAVRFTHPLLSSGAYLALGEEPRRMLHQRLATLVDDAEEQARHLAEGTAGPDAAVAATLDAASARARARGALDAAAELSERALALTPGADDESRLERTLTAAASLFAAGAPARAAALAEKELGRAEGAGRARILLSLAASRGETDGLAAAKPLLLSAVEHAAGDDALLARICRELAWNANASTDLEDAYGYARRGLAHATRAGIDADHAHALAQVAFLRFAVGQGLDRDALDAAVALDADPEADLSPTFIRGVLLLWAGDLEPARAVFETLDRRIRSRGEWPVAQAVTWLAVVDLRAGRWPEAIERLREARASLREFGFTQGQDFASALEAVAHAYRGDAAAVESLTGAVLGHPTSPQAEMDACCALGFLRLAEADARAADELLARGAALARRHGIVEPGVFVFAPDEIEAALLVGDHDRAEGLLSDFEARARRLGRTWALGAGARSRALLLDARGARSEALAAAAEALRHFEDGRYPFDQARARLVHGTLLRRARRLREARRSLGDAAAAFEELGARLWAERARAEAARLGGRPPRSATLTTTEQQVVELVVAGKSNHEVARALHVSPKTVEWNLSKIYKKLRVSSRTELAAKLSR